LTNCGWFNKSWKFCSLYHESIGHFRISIVLK